MTTVLITGATGFLGRHLIDHIRTAQPDARLRILARRATPWDADPALEVVRGDATSRADVRRAMEGADEVYHLAGLVSRDPSRGPELYRIHIEGTRTVLDAARETKPRRIVAVSSSGTIAVSRQPVVQDESADYATEVVADFPYYLSKIFAERLALDYAERHGVPVVVVNPTLILGPGGGPDSSNGDVARFLRAPIPAAPRGGVNIVDVRDTAAGLAAAMARGRPGARYLLGGVNWPLRQLFAELAGLTGRRAPTLDVPIPLARAGASVLRRALPLVGLRYELDDASICMSELFWYGDSTRARTELGFTTRPALETLRDTVAYLKGTARLVGSETAALRQVDATNGF